jgi:hypothetical protein
MDTLSNYVNARSLKLMASSANMFTTQYKSGSSNIVKFDFPGINLLDSSHHNQCDGMVQFSINALAGLPNGTVISNHAGIFFDDNPVVMTGTVSNIVGSLGVPSVKTAQNLASIYPNPATNLLTICATQGTFTHFTISNILGQEMISNTISQAETTIDIQKLPAGVYSINLIGNGVSEVQKLVKW